METILVWTLVIAAIAIIAMLVLLIASEREVKRQRLEADSLRAKLENIGSGAEERPDLLVNAGTAISSEVARLTEQVRANEVVIATLQCELEALRAENSWLKQESGASEVASSDAEVAGRERILPVQGEQLSEQRADFRLDLDTRKSRLVFPLTAAALLLLALVSVFFARGRTAYPPIPQTDSGPDSQVNLATASAVTTATDSDDLKPDGELPSRASGEKKRAGVPTGVTYEVVRSTRVFTEPNEVSRPLARIEAGMEIDVVGERDEWLEVRSRHGRPPGFIRKDTVVPKGP